MTPTTARGGRDPFLDVIRAAAMVAVVLNHYAYTLMFETASSGDPMLAMLQERGHPWVTWPFVWEIPAFFVPSAALAYRSAQRVPWRQFVGKRLWRLLLPVVPFALALVGLELVARATGAPTCGSWQGLGLTCTTAMPISPIWFLIVLIPFTVLTPLLGALWRSRWSLVAVAAVVGIAAASDLLRVATGSGLAINDVTVWLLVWFAGFAYADGTLDRLSARRWAQVAVATAVATAALMWVGPYPHYLYASPRSLLTVMECVVGTSVLMALRPWLSRLVERPRIDRWVGRIGSNMMGIFLWHYVAFAIAVTVLFALGIRDVDGLDISYLGQRLLVVAIALPLLLGFLVFARRVDAIPAPSRPRRETSASAPTTTRTAEP